jgi:hypothetical protein
MHCNVNGSVTDPLLVNQIDELDACMYQVALTHKLACGVPGSTGGGGSNNGGGGNSQKDTAANLLNLEAGLSTGLVFAGAAAALVAVFVTRQARARCGACHLPQVTISIKYSDDGEEVEHPAMLSSTSHETRTAPLHSMGR